MKKIDLALKYAGVLIGSTLAVLTGIAIKSTRDEKKKKEKKLKLK